MQDKEFVNSVLERINADSLRSFLKTLSLEPHIAASERDRYTNCRGCSSLVGHHAAIAASPVLIPIPR